MLGLESLWIMSLVSSYSMFLIIKYLVKEVYGRCAFLPLFLPSCSSASGREGGEEVKAREGRCGNSFPDYWYSSTLFVSVVACLSLFLLQYIFALSLILLSYAWFWIILEIFLQSYIWCCCSISVFAVLYLMFFFICFCSLISDVVLYLFLQSYI